MFEQEVEEKVVTGRGRESLNRGEERKDLKRGGGERL